ncbi:MAG: hypothetical protein ACR2RD_02370 [Woeseiaceae bacterium]
MLTRSGIRLIALGVLTCSYLAFAADDSTVSDNTCVQCHATKQTGFSAPHSFGVNGCIRCHEGDDRGDTLERAHVELIAFPGNLENADRACGRCHANRVDSVTRNLMHTGHGIVDVTRRLINGHAGADDTVNLQSLEHSPADSMLRKLCAGCHLGQDKTEHKLDPTRDRGGGCLACHINDHPADSHAALTTKVSDARCFGCHSRSGRISLSYAGLAEVMPPSPEAMSGKLRLADSRHVERMPADVHYLAGMSCIDCHTAVGLMGAAGEAEHQRAAVDIACIDCHDNDNPRIQRSNWPDEFMGLVRYIPFPADDDTEFLRTSKEGSPLWHIQIRDDGAWLHTKNTNRTLRIPALENASHGNDDSHDRLTCSACHSQWVPQCFGCHMQYDADGSQWDHVDKALTPGRWNEQRSDVRNAPGTLGVNEDGQIEAFVPGMIMTVEHSDWETEKFIRVFAPLSPHTTGAARSCDSCHRSTVAVGLGEGEFVERSGKQNFVPAHEALQDGLPKDAWTNLDGSIRGDTPLPRQRPLDASEIEAVLSAPLH